MCFMVATEAGQTADRPTADRRAKVCNSLLGLSDVEVHNTTLT